MKSLDNVQKRVSMLLWGPHGGGKTTFAASAPGNKLIMSWDPDGLNSLGKRSDVYGIDLSAEPHSATAKFNATDDPYGIGPILADEANGIGTVIFDSATSFSDKATERGVSETKGATTERPSPGAYGARNALVLRMMSAMLAVTGKHNKHMIFTSHEDSEHDKDGNFMNFVVMLGGKTANKAGLRLSEVWHLNDDGKKRSILVRNGRMRKGLKTRMFDASTTIEYVSKYDQFGPDAPYGKHSLAEIFKAWEDNSYDKIPLPS